MLVSIIIRTLNEEKYLDELLSAIDAQEKNGFLCEVIIVDSGSTDKTLEIANKHKAKLTYINKQDFSFGRSLNIGCEFAGGEYLVFISGHCVPSNNNWLINLCEPLIKNKAEYVCHICYIFFCIPECSGTAGTNQDNGNREKPRMPCQWKTIFSDHVMGTGPLRE